MDLRQGIDKLKRVIFTKKSVAQDYKAEEGALSLLEEQARKEEAEAKALDEAIQATTKQIGDTEKKAKDLKEQLIKMTEEWQALALKLFQTEREGETFSEERTVLHKKKGIRTRLFSGFPQSLHLASQRTWWAEDELNPLSEDFRRDLILDNRDYVLKKRGDRKPKKTKGTEKQLEFNMDQAIAFITHGIPMPKWMEAEYLKQRNVQLREEIRESKSVPISASALK